jgi:hypothetical protein
MFDRTQFAESSFPPSDVAAAESEAGGIVTDATLVTRRSEVTDRSLVDGAVTAGQVHPRLDAPASTRRLSGEKRSMSDERGADHVTNVAIIRRGDQIARR